LTPKKLQKFSNADRRARNRLMLEDHGTAALENVISADFSGRVGARGRSRNG